MFFRCFLGAVLAVGARAQTPDPATPPPVVLDVRTEAAQCSVIARNTACLRYEKPPFPEPVGVKVPEFAIVRVTGPDGAAAVIQGFTLSPANRPWLRVRRIGAPVGGVSISDRLPIDLEIYVDGAQAIEMRSGRFLGTLTATVSGVSAPVKLPVQLAVTAPGDEDSISADPDSLAEFTVNASPNPQPVRFPIAVRRNGVGPPLQVSVTAETSDGGSWLRADQQGGFVPCATHPAPCGFEAIVTPPPAEGDYWGALLITGDGYSDRAVARITVEPATGQSPPVVTPAQVSLSAPQGSTAPVSTVVDVRGGYNGLAFRAQHSSPWLTIDPLSTRWPGQLKFFANPAGLDAGLYSETVQLRAVDTGELLYVVPVNFTVTAPAYLPAVLDGGGWSTSLVLVNPGLAAVNARLRFWSGGAGAGLAAPWELDVAGLGPAADIERFAVPPLGMRVIETRGVQAIRQLGWAEVAADGPLSVHAVLSESRTVAKGRAFVSDATLPVTSALRDRLLLPFDNVGGGQTSVLLANPENQAAVVEVAVLNEDGAELAREGRFMIAALGAGAFDLAAKWPSTAGRRGVLALDFAGRRLLGSGLRAFDGTGISAFPAVARGEPGAERGVVHVTAGGVAWRTTLHLANASALAQSGSLRVWPESPLAEFGEDAALQSVLPVPGSGMAVIVVRPPVAGAADPAASSSGWAESRYGKLVGGFALVGRTLEGSGAPLRFETVVAGEAGAISKLAIPFDYRGSAVTELILSNTDEQATEVQTVIYDVSGRFPRFGETFTVPGKGQISIHGRDRWELEGQQGLAVFWSRQNFRLLGVGLRTSMDDGQMAVLPGFEKQ